ncbi:uncharacterized protein I206_107450 [Kwoniella pini CBS 10737]|uniref:Copper chaperone n=1 Tax=Kwoniella pini CBS 10737 TaxID=1296096 RepID=A0A1B9HXB4_9TREE|nr:copper chaperone [Kwoniella pini CBS 10737]OCF47915.1 copper chaperone [Kwoniella pini CBS 10737]
MATPANLNVINSNPNSKPTVPAYQYNVKMTCTGCSGAVNRVLGKNIQPPNAYHISLPTQTVLVWGPNLPSFEEITQKISKTGKTINSQQLIDDATKIPSIEI